MSLGGMDGVRTLPRYKSVREFSTFRAGSLRIRGSDTARCLQEESVERIRSPCALVRFGKDAMSLMLHLILRDSEQRQCRTLSIGVGRIAGTLPI